MAREDPQGLQQVHVTRLLDSYVCFQQAGKASAKGQLQIFTSPQLSGFSMSLG
jgi:hypothetical protein